MVRMDFFQAHSKLIDAMRHRGVLLAASLAEGALQMLPIRITDIERDRISAEGYGTRGIPAGESVLLEVTSPSLLVWVVRAWVQEASQRTADVWSYVLEPAGMESEKLLEPRSVSAEVTRVRTARRIVTPDPQRARPLMDSSVMEKFSRLSANKAVAFEVDRAPMLVPMPSLFCASSDSLIFGTELFWRELSALWDGDDVLAGVVLEGGVHIASGRFRRILSPLGRFGLISVESIEELNTSVH